MQFLYTRIYIPNLCIYRQYIYMVYFIYCICKTKVQYIYNIYLINAYTNVSGIFICQTEITVGNMPKYFHI